MIEAVWKTVQFYRSHKCQVEKNMNLVHWNYRIELSNMAALRFKRKTVKTRLHKSRSSRDELEFDLSNFV